MPAFILAAPGPVFQDPNQQEVHVDATITTSGHAVFTGYGATEITLFVNVKASPSGTTPTLSFTIQEVDPGDGVTLIGATSTSTTITGIGVQRVTLASTFGGSIQVSWVVGGTASPTFTHVYTTLVAKAGSVALVDSSGAAIGSANPLSVALGSTQAPVPTSEVAPSAVFYGQATVVTPGTRVPLTLSSTSVHGLIVQALSTNAGSIWVGGNTVSASNGFELQAGQALGVATDDINKVYIDANIAGDKACFMGS